MSSSMTYYSTYVEETTKNNVQPIMAPRGEMVPDLDGEIWTQPEGRDAMAPKWGDVGYGWVSVYVSNMGRVKEVQSIMRGMSFVCAVHRNINDYRSFERAMPINTYLWG